MDIIQTFYDTLAAQYDKLFADWQATTQEQAALLDKIFGENGFDRSSRVLDCACGIGTQAIGLAALGYGVLFSVVPVLVYQGALTLLAGTLESVLQGQLLDNICMGTP